MEQISQLLFKYVEGTLLADEAVRLEAWADSDPANRQLLQKLDKDENLLTDIEKWYAIPFRSLSDDKRLYHEIVKHERRNNRYRLRRWVSYAAVALLVVTMGYFLFEYQNKATETQLTVSEILPGGNRATLTLSDGRVVELSEAQEEIIVRDGIMYADGSSVAENRGEVEHDGQQSMLFYELNTPKGGTYQLILPDSSKVWLNASSKLRYPSKFDDNERVVELEGEAYFDVKEQRRDGERQPFLIKTTGQTVQVVGTEFNISAYPDEAAKTTLVNGIVEVANHRTKTLRKLVPNQQAILHGTKTSVKYVDVKQYIGWKEGKIVLEGRTLPEILREIARWYDIEIRYEGDIPQGIFFGRVNRSSRLETVLRLLESANMDYRMEGRTLVVKNRTH